MASYDGHLPYRTQCLDLDNHSESSESDESASYSSSSSYDEFDEPEWVEDIGTKGALFYIESSLNPARNFEQSNVSEGKNASAKNKERESTTRIKLKEWVKHKRKQLKKRFNSSHQETVKDSATEVYEPPNVVEKIVYLDVDANSPSCNTQHITLSEKFFGLGLSRSDKEEDKVVVSEIISQGVAYQEGTIKIGDHIKSIDEIDITCSNLNSTLESIKHSKQVQIIVESCSTNKCDDSEVKAEEKDKYSFHHFTNAVEQSDNSHYKNPNLPHAIYYLALNSESTEENGDVLYYYPNMEGMLFQLKGMYVTMNQMISEVATPPVLNCTVTVKNISVQVCFVMDGMQMMVFALPQSSVDIGQIQHISSEIVKLLRFQFSTLSSAFGDVENHGYLNQLFDVLFHRLLLPQSGDKLDSQLLYQLPSVHWFPLPCNDKIVVDDILCQFESADFSDISDGYYNGQRLYNILGSCLFHKGYLIGSHLNKDDLLDVYLFIKFHQLLHLTKNQSVGKVIVWKECYPSRLKQSQINTDPDFVETIGRYFILIVALKHNILATILEAGGCSLKAEGYPTPDPFYVDHAENTLYVLEDAGIFKNIGKLIATQIPQLVCPEKHCKVEEKRSWGNFSSIVGLNSSHRPNLGKPTPMRSHSYSSLLVDDQSKRSVEKFNLKSRPHDNDFDRQQLLSHMGPADGESDEENEFETNRSRFRHDSSSLSSNSDHQNNAESKSRFNSSYDVRSHPSLEQDVAKESPQKSTFVRKTSLFYYLHMDPVEGVFLAPTAFMRKLLHGPLGQTIVSEFQSCCLTMRTNFERSLRNRLNPVARKCRPNLFLQAVQEQGAMFQCAVNVDGTNSQKKSCLKLAFWVIGKVFFTPEPREVYICYHDSFRENISEFSYSLNFGLSL